MGCKIIIDIVYMNVSLLLPVMKMSSRSVVDGSGSTSVLTVVIVGGMVVGGISA